MITAITARLDAIEKRVQSLIKRHTHVDGDDRFILNAKLRELKFAQTLVAPSDTKNRHAIQARAARMGVIARPSSCGKYEIYICVDSTRQ